MRTSRPPDPQLIFCSRNSFRDFTCSVNSHFRGSSKGLRFIYSRSHFSLMRFVFWVPMEGRWRGLSLCVSVELFVCLSLVLFICLFVCAFMRLFACGLIFLCLSNFVCLFICFLFVSLFIYLFVYLLVSLLICFFVYD